MPPTFDPLCFKKISPGVRNGFAGGETAPASGETLEGLRPGPLRQLRRELAEASKTLKWIGELSFLANSPKKLRVLPRVVG